MINKICTGIFQIPIFLSQALTDCLYVYQYPVRPANKDWESIHVAKASFKPKNQIVRLEVGLDIDSDKYNASKGEQIAINTDGMQVILSFKNIYAH